MLLLSEGGKSTMTEAIWRVGFSRIPSSTHDSHKVYRDSFFSEKSWFIRIFRYSDAARIRILISLILFFVPFLSLLRVERYAVPSSFLFEVGVRISDLWEEISLRGDLIAGVFGLGDLSVYKPFGGDLIAGVFRLSFWTLIMLSVTSSVGVVDTGFVWDADIVGGFRLRTEDKKGYDRRCLWRVQYF